MKYLSRRISTQSEMPYRPLGISLGAGGAVKVRLPSQVQVRSYRRRRNSAAVGTHVDLDLLGIFGITAET